MSNTRRTIAGVWNDENFPMSQAVIEPEGKRVHLTGQVAWTESFEVISPRDAGKQAHAATDNIERIHASLGGGLRDIVSTTMYYIRDETLWAFKRRDETGCSSKLGPQ
jgi:enamine deaminase RidA (YjgF/YER057c/UK114 family)